MNKKLVFFLSILLVIIIMILAFFLSKKNSNRPSPTPTPSANKISLQESGLKEKVFFPAFSNDGKYIFYLGDQGIKIKKFDFASHQTDVLYEDDLFFINNTYWSPDRNWVIIKNNDPEANTSNQLYDLKNKIVKDLDSNIQNILWSQDSQKIFYQYLNSGNNQKFLAESAPDGSNWKKIIDLQYDNYGLIWLNNFPDIGFWTIPSDVGGTRLKSVNIQNKAVKEIFSDYHLGNASASPDGSYIAYDKFHSEGSNYTIAYSKSDGSKDADTGIQSTSDKIAWINQNVFVVASRPEDNTSDIFYKINADSGQKEELKYESQSDIEAQNLFISKDDKTLYFTSDDILYGLTLP